MRKVKIEIIPNEKGDRTNLSMVCLKSTTIFYSKRLIGFKFNNPNVQNIF